MRRAILDAGLEVARTDGIYGVSFQKVGTRLNVTHQAVIYYFARVAILRDAVAQHAVDTKNIDVVAQLITVRHPVTRKFDTATRTYYLAARV